jgi:hypothetical protein
MLVPALVQYYGQTAGPPVTSKIGNFNATLLSYSFPSGNGSIRDRGLLHWWHLPPLFATSWS